MFALKPTLGMVLLGCLLSTLPAPAQVAPKGVEPAYSAARVWDEALLFAIRRERARPTVHARNLYHTAAAMWDAWAAYEPTAVQVIHHERAVANDTEAARAEAISYAMYRILTQRFATSPGVIPTQAEFDATMDALGYDREFVTTEGDSPAALGNRIAASILAFGLADGSNEANGYAIANGYTPVNEPLVVALPLSASGVIDPNRWQPLALEFFVDQGGIVLGPYPPFLTPHWGAVTNFSMAPSVGTDDFAWYDPGMPPLYGGEDDAEFKDAAREVIYFTSLLDPDDGVMIDISPSAKGNNPLGTRDGTGHEVNPFTGLPYAPQLVPRGDWGRVLAEFWADGPNSETPPGHWNTVANYVSDNVQEKRIGGVGPIVNDLEWDVKLYLALNGAVHDAGIAAWGVKNVYDYVRPITMIRYMGVLGQSSDPEGPSYHPGGLPLEEGLIEVITAESTAPGERHAHLLGREGEIAVRSWPGEPENPETEYTGVEWIRSRLWVPYQRPTFVSPPFAAYVSGHSTFSRSAAEVLTAFTGSEYFPNGLGEFHAPQNEYLVFEDGPSVDVTLEWATYYDAADESGLSRLYGGIHVRADDFAGRIMGSKIGKGSWEKAQTYYDGRAAHVSADQDGDYDVSLSELLRVIQFYNSNGYCCEAGTEDGFAPGLGQRESCVPHSSDYNEQNWIINLSELLRLIQFYNSDCYNYCPGAESEDGFCPGCLI